MKKQPLNITQVLNRLKKVVIIACVTFTMYSVPAVGMAMNFGNDLHIERNVIVSTALPAADPVEYVFEISQAPVEADTAEALLKLGDWIEDAPSIKDQAMRVASALHQIRYKRIVLDAAPGDSTLDYMMVLEDDTVIMLAVSPEGLSRDLVGVNVFKGREPQLSEIMTLGELSDMISMVQNS